MEDDEQLKEKEVNMKDISILLLWRSTISLSSAAGLTYSNSTALNLQLEENCFMRCHTKITEAVEQNKGYDCKRQSETV